MCLREKKRRENKGRGTGKVETSVKASCPCSSSSSSCSFFVASSRRQREPRFSRGRAFASGGRKAQCKLTGQDGRFPKVAPSRWRKAALLCLVDALSLCCRCAATRASVDRYKQTASLQVAGESKSKEESPGEKKRGRADVEPPCGGAALFSCLDWSGERLGACTCTRTARGCEFAVYCTDKLVNAGSPAD